MNPVFALSSERGWPWLSDHVLFGKTTLLDRFGGQEERSRQPDVLMVGATIALAYLRKISLSSLISGRYGACHQKVLIPP